MALSWGDLQEACSIVRIVIMWNDGIKDIKALFSKYANFALVIAF